MSYHPSKGSHPVNLASQFGTWGREAMQASIDRDDAARAARPVEPSTSIVAQRCSTCGHWGMSTTVFCGNCRVPWEPAPLRGLPIAHKTEPPPHRHK